MKKTTYIQPAIRIRSIETEGLLAASNEYDQSSKSIIFNLDEIKKDGDGSNAAAKRGSIFWSSFDDDMADE